MDDMAKAIRAVSSSVADLMQDIKTQRRGLEGRLEEVAAMVKTMHERKRLPEEAIVESDLGTRTNAEDEHNVTVSGNSQPEYLLAVGGIYQKDVVVANGQRGLFGLFGLARPKIVTTSGTAEERTYTFSVSVRMRDTYVGYTCRLFPSDWTHRQLA